MREVTTSPPAPERPDIIVPIQDLPDDVTGLVAHGTVSRDDDDAVVTPLLERAESADS